MNKLTLPIYDLTGKETGTIELNSAIFGVAFNATLLHQAVVSFLANRRATTAHTKDRSDVAGSNKKPWRQKGTGNARAGSTRSPLWRGGGVTFGPSNERNYSVRMPQKMKQAALKVALSSKASDNKLVIVDSLDSLDGKTKSWVKAEAALPEAKAKKLIISGTKNELAERAIRNIEGKKYVSADSITIFDITRFPVIVMTKDALAAIEDRLAPAGAQVVAAKAKKEKVEV